MHTLMIFCLNPPLFLCAALTFPIFFHFSFTPENSTLFSVPFSFCYFLFLLFFLFSSFFFCSSSLFLAMLSLLCISRFSHLLDLPFLFLLLLVLLLSSS